MPIAHDLDRLRLIYDAMDRAYMEVARLYGFQCMGCEDNCCTTRFYHYTLTEYLYLLEGFSTLDAVVQEDAVRRARVICNTPNTHTTMCPLNVQDRCIIYPFRPMICRLHGVPFEFYRPDGRWVQGPGCARFERDRVVKGSLLRRINRTSFYQDLATLEIKVRQQLHYNGRFKKSVAEMLRNGTTLAF